MLILIRIWIEDVYIEFWVYDRVCWGFLDLGDSVPCEGVGNSKWKGIHHEDPSYLFSQSDWISLKKKKICGYLHQIGIIHGIFFFLFEYIW